MHRGDIWISADSGYASKPRPVVIIQSDRYSKDDSIITTLVTTDDVFEKEYRVELQPTEMNGLKEVSYVMIDKIFSFPRRRLNRYIGKLDDDKINEIFHKLVDFLSE